MSHCIPHGMARPCSACDAANAVVTVRLADLVELAQFAVSMARALDDETSRGARDYPWEQAARDVVAPLGIELDDATRDTPEG